MQDYPLRAVLRTGTPMFSMNMTISVPASVNIGRLRDEFTRFCDELNLDATLEPVRHIEQARGRNYFHVVNAGRVRREY
jgi:hypothetical protein